MLAEGLKAATNKAKNVIASIERAWPTPHWVDVTLLVAVSGGADSTALARALHTLRKSGEGRIVLVHFNHRLRGEESEGDQEFVRDLANSLDLPSDIGQARNATMVEATSEEALRNQRYQFFTEAAGRWGARYLATAHTADDQVETVLQRVFRGTGVSGLAGIPFTRRLNEFTTIVRPMLGVWRQEVLAYLSTLQQSYRTDGSNGSEQFLRNRLRTKFIPWIEEEIHPQARQAIWRLAAQAEEQSRYISAQACLLLDQFLISESDHMVILDTTAAQGAPPFLLRQALVEVWRRRSWREQGMGRKEWLQLADFLITESSAPLQLPGQVVARRLAEGKLLISNAESSQP